MIGRVVSHYEILAKLGEGGMGVLYNGWDFPFAGGWGMGPRRQVGAS